MLSVKNLSTVFASIRDAGVPDRFTHEFLKQLGFTSSTDRGVINVMKAMRFLDDSSAPTDRYRRYRDAAISEAVMAEALRDAYADLFKINESAQSMSPAALKGAFKRISGKGDSTAEKMASTFKSLAALADWTPGAAAAAAETGAEPDQQSIVEPGDEAPPPLPPANGAAFMPVLRHDVHVHLPISTDVKVYDAIFRSLREHFG